MRAAVRSDSTEPVNLDRLLTMSSSAALAALRDTAGLRPTGAGGVCFHAAGAGTAPPAHSDLLALVDTGGGFDVSARTDEFGYTWITCRHSGADLAALVPLLHRVNVLLVDAGLGRFLQYTSVGFTGRGQSRLALVYLVGHGTFYPFAPQRVPLRDNALELRIRSELGADLPIEPDISRWFPTWNAPVP